jgi:hypothetical protein
MLDLLKIPAEMMRRGPSGFNPKALPRLLY